MVGSRDKIVDIINYLEKDLKIQVNIAKNKARGNNGIFCTKCGQYRIDISKSISDESVLNILLHEFAHYIHYKYDKTLSNLNFIFADMSEKEEEELLSITVDDVSKDFAHSLYSLKDKYKAENSKCIESIKNIYPSFLVSKPFKEIEKSIKTPYKYLLKYDAIKLNNSSYSIIDLSKYKELSICQINYLKLRSNYRKLSKINSKINRLNKYYNQPTELWARFFEYYFTNTQNAYKIAPILCASFKNTIDTNRLAEITKIYSILN